MLVNREICLSFHFDEIENIRPTVKKNSKMARLKYIAHASLEEVFSSLWISIDLRENSLRFIFFFFFSFIFFDTTSINVVKDVVSRKKHGRVIVYLDE